MVRGPCRELSPKHSTIIPSTVEASDSEVRVAVRGPLESARTPRKANVSETGLLILKVTLSTWFCGVVILHRMKELVLGRVHVTVTVSSGQATMVESVKVAAKNIFS